MVKAKKRSTPRPLNASQLEALAMRQSGRFLMSPRGLAAYLQRKIAQYGWDDDEHALDLAIETIVSRLEKLGIVSELGLAQAIIANDARRSLGAMRTRQKLKFKGVTDEVLSQTLAETAHSPTSLAFAFAERKKLGPFRPGVPSQNETKNHEHKDIAAMVRAGHALSLAMRIIRAPSITALREALEITD